MAGKTPEFGVLPTNTVVITTIGLTNYTVPVGVAFLKIRACGGGGAGGGSTASGGGASGAYFEAIFRGITAGTVIPITVGSGGFPNGGSGTDTIVAGVINLTAGGGSGGGSGGSGFVAGGTGGTVTGTLTSDVIAVNGAYGGYGFGSGGIANMGEGGDCPLFGGFGHRAPFTAGSLPATAYGSGGGGGYGSGSPGFQGVVIIEEHY